MGKTKEKVKDDGRLLRAIKEQEAFGYCYEDAPASLKLFSERILNRRNRPFQVSSYHVSARGDGVMHICEASVKVVVAGKIHHSVADGNGPVSALDAALRLALETSYPIFRQARLTNFHAHVVGGCEGVDSKIGVQIAFAIGDMEWRTMGVSANLFEASLIALADAFEYALLLDQPVD